MHDLKSRLRQTRRPRLLIRAARIAAEDYRRGSHLPRMLGAALPARHGAAVLQLLEIEGQMDDRRQARDAAYSVARHVEALAALIGEARLLAETEGRVT